MSDHRDNPDSGSITAHLQRAADGDQAAFDELLAIVYSELRDIAGKHMHKERRAHSLAATDLVHEAYLRLKKDEIHTLLNRRMFYYAASKAMWRILIERGRKKQLPRQRSGIDVEQQSLADGTGDLDTEQLNRLLETLRVQRPRAAEVVEMRFAGGLQMETIAEILDVSKRSVELDWTFAKKWFATGMGGSRSADDVLQ